MRLFVDELTNLDFSYLDAERGLVGETWLANIELEGALDEQGMVCDFGTVKKRLRQWLDDNIDHKLLIPIQSASLTEIKRGDDDELEWQSARGTIRTRAPAQAHTFIEAPSITPATVAEWCTQQFRALFPSSVQRISVYFSTESISGPYYHYSHGLKKHQGNCQRIAHGHRSKIEIWENGELATDKMQYWAERWRDAYLGTEGDAREDSSLAGNLFFHYDAPQGHFEISLPKAHCYLIGTETTVEFIAKHLASALKQQHPLSTFVVKAYEGKSKGAIAESD